MGADTHPKGLNALAASSRQFVAILVSIVLHLAILAIAIVASWIQTQFDRTPVLAEEPLVVVSVALLMAHCSLGAIWWTTSPWPSHIKTLVAIAACALTWALTIVMLSGTEFRSIESAGWAISMLVQAVLAGLLTSIIDMLRRRRAGQAVGDRRFTVLFLLIWMAVIGVLLGAARFLTQALGWSQDITSGQYFYQLLAVGIANGLLAACMYASLAWRGHGTVPERVGLLLATMFVIVASFVLQTIFANMGVTTADLVWLFGSEAAFLLATLSPLRLSGLFPRATQS